MGVIGGGIRDEIKGFLVGKGKWGVKFWLGVGLLDECKADEVPMGGNGVCRVRGGGLEGMKVG